jgi:hypothetical protein
LIKTLKCVNIIAQQRETFMSTSSIGSIKVYNLANPPVVWEKPLQDAADYRAIKEMCLSGSAVDLPYIWLFPVRTNTLGNFAEDFFFPTLYHGASRVDSLAQRLIENFVTFLIDLLTLPIRIVTCIPRALYNAQQKEHRLLTYLKQNSVPKQLIETDHVEVELKGDFGKNSSFKEESLFSREKRTVLSQSGELTVQFVTYPLHPPGGMWTSHLVPPPRDS